MAPDLIADPETDPTATYAVDPALARRLARRVVAAPRGAQFVSHTPLTGAPLASLPLSTREDVASAVDAARAAQRSWSRTPMELRERIFLRYHDLVLERQVELLDIVQLESGKTRRQAFEEVADVALVARHYARSAAAYLRPRRRAGLFPVLTQSTVHHHARGVVGIISPWNYPLSLAITDAIPALLAGNAVVLRPDEQASLTALHAVQLLTEAGLPESVLQVVLGDGPTVGQAVVDLSDYVCYTGSTQTGRQVATSVAGRLVGYSLELGGKNSMYVADDADLDKAVEGAVRACFSSAGQLCISIERLLVHESVADEFTRRFVAAVGEMKLGAELAYGVDMGSLVSAAQLERVVAHVDDARAKGARVLVGGRARPDVGPYFYEPTVIEGVTAAMQLRDDETFGPVVSIYRVHSDQEAIRLANDTEYGLNAAVYTRDVARGRRIATSIEAGTVNINEGYAAAWGSVASPMGGMKQSGVGRRHGSEGILKYTESQNVTAQYVLPIAPVGGMGEETYARLMTGALTVLKALGRR
ncbi:succinate-semialdehyde dehydrogenase/glutarate-semialdehyde dehydrogenase [Phycicoccus badiiscoriae]|uniref:succinate-semialdehyde dehydrogenase (NADP(+)) n=1 Tax=Pedococcus badiiscoriae TaxID=642776 RepID=A0A852WL27_9MICO|nr:succinic semialdehyde dehydrogenase [Pedococcus badiiscoriae]NYG07464.1 succinate-semialdehyde dehydrogenase/glutarate-semialdehyde dehydrogenase [Pedococcus badiiscoriae]